MERVSENSDLLLMEIPLIDVIDSRRALMREDI